MTWQIELKHNSCITNDPCAICGNRCEPNGLDAFLAGTWELVCSACTKKHTAGTSKVVPIDINKR